MRQTRFKTSDTGVAKSLLLLNSNEVLGKLSSPGSRTDRFAKAKSPDGQNIGESLWSAIGREPAKLERTRADAHLAGHANSRRGAYEDVIWALINTKEFQFVE